MPICVLFGQAFCVNMRVELNAMKQLYVNNVAMQIIVLLNMLAVFYAYFM